MSEQTAPWVRTRGLGRLLAQETNVSDLIQFLSDCDPSPWLNLIGFVPEDVVREASTANNADLLLTSGEENAVIEVKLGHLMSVKQQEQYEALPSHPALYMAALSGDEVRLATVSDRWTFLSLTDIVKGWEGVEDQTASLLAREVAEILGEWDRMITGVFDASSATGGLAVDVLNQKFLARVVTRRIAQDLRGRGRLACAGVLRGGGLPLIEAWTPVRNEGVDRTFIAEVRWWETKPGGELRLGVDFEPRPGQEEDEEVRRAAYDLAHSMDTVIDAAALKEHLAMERPDLAELLRREKRSRPRAKGDWEQVIVKGFAGSPLEGGRRNNRQRTTPGFYGDGTMRFQAISDVDFSRASAHDLTELIDLTLSYLSSRQPPVAFKDDQP